MMRTEVINYTPAIYLLYLLLDNSGSSTSNWQSAPHAMFIIVKRVQALPESRPAREIGYVLQITVYT